MSIEIYGVTVTPSEPLPPRRPPSEVMLLQQLRETGIEYWTLYSPDVDEVLQALHDREPHLLRRSVTKRYGVRWRIA